MCPLWDNENCFFYSIISLKFQTISLSFSGIQVVIDPSSFLYSCSNTGIWLFLSAILSDWWRLDVVTHLKGEGAQFLWGSFSQEKHGKRLEVLFTLIWPKKWVGAPSLLRYYIPVEQGSRKRLKVATIYISVLAFFK